MDHRPYRHMIDTNISLTDYDFKKLFPLLICVIYVSVLED